MDTGRVDLPTTTIVKEVAKRENVDERELVPPLGAVIDTDALNAFLTFQGQRESTRSGFVRFSYYGYVVTVRFDGEISIEE